MQEISICLPTEDREAHLFSAVQIVSGPHLSGRITNSGLGMAEDPLAILPFPWQKLDSWVFGFDARLENHGPN